MQNYDGITPKELRNLIAQGKMNDLTVGLCPGYVQANLIVLEGKYADDFREFARKNPKPCPVLDVSSPGDPHVYKIANGANLATDLPRYNVFRFGEKVEECPDVSKYWTDDMVGFVIGCSLSFEQALIDSGIRIRYIEDGRNGSDYLSNIMCEPAGVFNGPMVVSMRPVKPELVPVAYEVTERYPHVHGGPVYHGAPEKIGIKDINCPEWGDPPVIGEGEIPVFWACGVTPQVLIKELKPAIAISHTPGYMFVGDYLNDELESKLFSVI